MTKYTIEIESPRLEEVMLKTFERMEVENQVRCAYDGNTITIKTDDSKSLDWATDTLSGKKPGEYDEMIFPGPPMTSEQFWKEIEESEKDIREGRYYTTEELKSHYLKWKNSK